MSALSLEGLAVGPRGGAPLIRDVSLRIAHGGALAVLGESGSGKSLVVSALFGLLPPELKASGQIQIAGTTLDAGNTRGLQRLWRRQLALVPQEPERALNPLMRLGRHWRSVWRGPASNRIANSIAQVDLDPATSAQYPHQLSGGMLQRALLATADLTDAPIIVADEPTKGLDGARIGHTIDQFLRLRADGRTLLIVTHDVSLARALGGDIAMVRDGQVVETGPADEVLTRPRHSYTSRYLAALPERWRPSLRCVRVEAPVLQTREVAIGYAGKPALVEGLSFAARPQSITAVVGASGTGKTSLARVLLGLSPPRAGQVDWFGQSLSAMDRRTRQRLRPRFQLLPQDPAASFAPDRSLGSQLLALAQIDPDLDVAARLPGLLERLHLHPTLLDRRAGEVSGGEAQRLALVRALLTRPAFLIADEPTSRLDPVIQADTIRLLRDLVRDHTLALVLISHDAELVAKVADGVVSLDPAS